MQDLIANHRESPESWASRIPGCSLRCAPMGCSLKPQRACGACCHGRQTSQEQPVCLGCKALKFSRPPVTQLSNSSASELGTKQAWEA